MIGQTMINKTLVIFGSTGDLTYRKLIPALYNLFERGELAHTKVCCVGRRDYTTDDYLSHLKSWISENARFKLSTSKLEAFYKHIIYLKMPFTEVSSYHLLDHFYKENPCLNNVIYYAVAPHFFEVITEGVQTLKHCQVPKIIIEKPFGASLKEAYALNEKLVHAFKEENVYRIDHYLGKEMVRNILTIRESNPIIQAVYDGHFIDRVDIKAFETIGVESRASYYENAGALKDMVQNHLLQILTIVALPDTGGTISEQQMHVLKHLKIKGSIEDTMLLGQYDGYRQEKGVAQDSIVETYARLRLFVDLPMWKDVPFYIETGKKTKNREMTVTITFKQPNKALKPNVLTIHIQPVEGVELDFNIKTPGFDSVTSTSMTFCQNCDLTFRLNTPEAYERMLLSCFENDNTWFAKWDQIETSWKFIENLYHAYHEKQLPVLGYAEKTNGPKQ